MNRKILQTAVRRAKFESDFRLDNFRIFKGLRKRNKKLADRDSFSLLRYLYDWESKNANPHAEIPLAGLLGSISSYFDNLLSIGRKIGIKNQAQLQSTYSAIYNWKAFEPKIPVQPIQAELIFLQGLDVDDFVIRDTLNLIRLNRNYQHELLHGILFRLIPKKGRIQNRDYFLFIEALVFALERYTAEEIGPFLTGYFCHFGVLDREFNEVSSLSARQLFKASFVSFLMCMHDRETKSFVAKIKKRNLYLKSASVYVPKKFVQVLSQDWLHLSRSLQYPAKWRTKKFPYQKLVVDDFSFSAAISEQSLEQLSLWAEKTFKLEF